MTHQMLKISWDMNGNIMVYDSPNAENIMGYEWKLIQVYDSPTKKSQSLPRILNTPDVGDGRGWNHIFGTKKNVCV
jgi:hypothetical protein